MTLLIHFIFIADKTYLTKQLGRENSKACYGIIPSMEYMNPQLKNEYSKPTPRAIFRLHQTTMVDYSYYQFHTPQSWALQRCCRRRRQ